MKEFKREYQLVFKLLSKDYLIDENEAELIQTTFFLKLIREHRLIQIIYPKLFIETKIPKKFKDELRKELSFVKFEMLRMYAELINVTCVFKGEGIDLTVLKGPVLSKQLYNDIALRKCKDLDVLVSKKDLSKALSVLKKLGYLELQHSHSSLKQEELYHENFHDYELYNPEKDVYLELHWFLFSPMVFPSEINTFFSFEKYDDTTLKGVTVLVQSDNLLYLAIHGGHHRWKRLIWSFDFAALLNKSTKEDVLRAYQKSKLIKGEFFFLEALFLVDKLYGFEAYKTLDLPLSPRVKKLVLNSQWFINDLENEISLKSAGHLRREFLYRVKKMRGELLLGGGRMVIRRNRGLLVQPQVWGGISFPDKYFSLNIILMPFLYLIYKIKEEIGIRN